MGYDSRTLLPESRHRSAADPPVEVSVVICTCDRPDSLRDLLTVLDHQIHRAFEVVVVKGPGDETVNDVLIAYDGRIRVAEHGERNLSASRNLGLSLARGEVVAFCDDDALPTSGWLRDLLNGFDGPGVAGVGGVVLDRDGFGIQYRFAACDRLGETRLNVTPPLAVFLEPGAPEFIYLQGTNMAFRRDDLRSLGGFSEDLLYQYDDVEICRKLIDSGRSIRPITGGTVVHRYLSSAARDDDGVYLDPWTACRDRATYAVRAGEARFGAAAVDGSIAAYLRRHADHADLLLTAGRISRSEHRTIIDRSSDGCTRGLEAARAGADPATELGERDDRAIDPYPLRQDQPFRVCFASRDYPPDMDGGVGRFTLDLATGFAATGAEVHVLIGTEGAPEMFWEQDRWVHRLPHNPRFELDGTLNGGALANALTVLLEVRRIASHGSIDLLSAPLWGCEGVIASLDPDLTTVTTIMTSFATIASFHPSWGANRQTHASSQLERSTVSRIRHIHALSNAVLEDVAAAASQAQTTAVIPLGSEDRFEPRSVDRRDRGVEILFVGRLERRKGVDILLEAFADVHAHHPGTRLTVAGAITANTELGRTYPEAFAVEHAGHPDLLEAVSFLGKVSEQELAALYNRCDIFCSPSLYESFGLVNAEAMACGKPVVSCAVGGIPEVVRDGLDGFLVPPADPVALARALERLVADPELRDQLGRASRHRFEEHLELEVATRRTEQAYRRAVAADVAPTRPLAEEFETLLQELGYPDESLTRAVIEKLLDPARHPIDPAVQIRLAWNERDARFVDKVHEVILGRTPNRARRAWYSTVLTGGRSRLTLVEELAFSEEALMRRGSPDWLGELDDLRESSAATRTATRLIDRVGRMIVDMLRRSPIFAITRSAIRRVGGAAIAEPVSRLGGEVRGAQERARVEIRDTFAHIEEMLAAQDERFDASARRVNAAFVAQTKRIDLLQRRQERVALDLRERMPAGAFEAPEPRVLRELPEGPFRVNIGCGEQPLDGYVNVDHRELSDVDVVADARKIPFARGAAKEIAAFHLVEHFRETELRQVVLPHWREILGEGGRLRIVCPNWEAMIRDAAAGRISLGDLRTVTFGLQDYDGDDHLAMYGPDQLCALLAEEGFSEIEVVEPERPNGLCLEMEVIASR